MTTDFGLRAQTVPASSRGRSADPAKYALFAAWAEKEFGFTLDPPQAQFAVLQYKHFQASDMTRCSTPHPGQG